MVARAFADAAVGLVARARPSLRPVELIEDAGGTASPAALTSPTPASGQPRWPAFETASDPSIC